MDLRDQGPLALFGGRLRDRLPAGDALSALVAGQLHDAPVHLDRHDAGSAKLHRLLNDEVHLVRLGQALKEQDPDRQLHLRRLHADQAAAHTVLRKGIDRKAAEQAVLSGPVRVPHQEFLPRLHPQDISDVIVVLPRDLEHVALHGGEVREYLQHICSVTSGFQALRPTTQHHSPWSVTETISRPALLMASSTLWARSRRIPEVM